jgi:3-oxoacid CoA-transferase
LTIVEAENIVEIGEIKPMDVDLPGIYIDRIVPATVEKKIELLTLHEEDDAGSESDASSASTSSVGSTDSAKSAAYARRVRIAKRAAKEVRHAISRTKLPRAGPRLTIS